MKKIFTAAVFVCLALSAGAQNMSDAINFSQNNYTGSARTMAMGNAVTAVGGDLGTIGINPAGSAVAGYSQFTISPGLSISATSSSYSPVGDTDFGNLNRQRHTRAYMPNVGLSMCMEGEDGSAIRNMTLAIVSNHTNNYQNYFCGYGTNAYTSRFGEFATAATGLAPSEMGSYDSFYNSSISWDLLTGYQANLFSDYGGGNTYVGSSEAIGANGQFYVPGVLSQSTECRKSGYKSDVVLNMGLNFNDNFFLGFNIGLPEMEYQYDEYYTEAPVTPDLFPITFKDGDRDVNTTFDGGTFDYSYIASVSGIYAKAGFIWLPSDHLRIGAAIQSPSSYTVEERWQYSGSSSFGNSSFDASYESPEGDYTYCLRTPWIVNAGLSWTFGGRGLVSVDYEMTDYSVMKFSDVYEDTFNDDLFYEQNKINRLFAGRSHNLRLGGELRVNPMFSLRAGYTILTCPEKHYVSAGGADVTADMYGSDFDSYDRMVKTLGQASYYKEYTTSVSAGAGYSSAGSFFADFAVRRTKYPVSYISPFYDYENMNSAGEIVNVASPRIRTDRSLWEAVLTVGWRF